jgi:hypothetical protein
MLPLRLSRMSCSVENGRFECERLWGEKGGLEKNGGWTRRPTHSDQRTPMETPPIAASSRKRF